MLNLTLPKIILFYTLTVVLAVLFYSSLLSLGTDTAGYIDYLTNSHDYSSPLSLFMFKPEIGWSILVYFVQNIFTSKEIQLLTGKLLILTIFTSFILKSTKNVIREYKYKIIFFAYSFLSIYLVSDIYLLGAVNSIRTGASIVFLMLSLWCYRLSLFLDKKNINNLFLCLFLCISFLFHSASLVVLAVVVSSLFLNRIFDPLTKKIKFSPLLKSLFVSTIGFFLLRLSPIFTQLSLYAQESSSVYGSQYKFLFDIVFAFFILSRSMHLPLSLKDQVLLVTVASLIISFLGLALVGNESMNRLEQFSRSALLFEGVFWLSISRSDRKILFFSSWLTVLLITSTSQAIIINLS